MTVDEMRERAGEAGFKDPIWLVGAEICERLESVLDALMEEVAFDEVAAGELISAKSISDAMLTAPLTVIPPLHPKEGSDD